MGIQRDSTKELMYYASDWTWPVEIEGQIKSMLLFFDGVALSLPTDLLEGALQRSPLAQPLHEQGLLVNLAPEQHIRPETSEELTRSLLTLVEGTDWERVAPYWVAYEMRSSFHSSPQFTAASGAFLDAMHRRGLAIPIGPPHPSHVELAHPVIRQLVLLAYCRALHHDLQQATDFSLQPVAHATSPEALSNDYFSRPSHEDYVWTRAQHTGMIVDADLNEICPDLSDVPLDEVLDFRREHGKQFRSYAEGVRALVSTWQGLTDDQVTAELRERRARLKSEARDLLSVSQQAFLRNTGTVTLGLSGAVWTALHGGDLIGALLAATAAGAAITRPAPSVTAYSYLFAVKRKWR
ncbi:hypothetical protein [Streptomyces roseifaciens]|uniref:hypothetical protein n=1 Tax=Streptomyces roseifaciens TaxID=1488406 RepID=UPI00071812AE|nr:hypothetical protein [Streptomyces roseifaciens]